MARDIELIRRDAQIADLQVQLFGARLEVAQLRMERAELDAGSSMMMQQQAQALQKQFAGELAAAMREVNPPPPAIAPSGEPLRVEASPAGTGA